MKVILIGYRATGKTTVGMLLASKLRIPFFDTDLLVEEKLSMPIKEIVAGRGWNYFRAREKEAIQILSQKSACVAATGGGIVLARENVESLKQMGVVIWLDAPLQDIIKRLQEDAQNGARRPQFTDGSLIQETIKMLKQRIPLYEKAADFSLDTSGKSAAQVAEDIYQHLLESGNLEKINKSRNASGDKYIPTGE